MNWILSVVILTLLTGRVRADCPNTAGVVFGTIAGTLVVIGIILLIVWLLRRKKTKQDEDKTVARVKRAGEHTYDNPNFVGDVEAANTSAVNSPQKTLKEQQSSFAEKGFGGYVECQETPPRQQGALGSSRQTNGVGLYQGQRSGVQYGVGGHPLRKTGSRGSLDNSYPSTEPELVSVSLRSHDIIGLGFNICGNVSGGIYVSKVLNRGPASESGCIKTGDRVMSITISFENMVYEDALTILSYASPYPVQVELQKAGTVRQDTEDAVERSAVATSEAKPIRLHPLYRSQSMDDVNKINSDSEVCMPRRTYSEMKKSTPILQDTTDGAEIVTGSLKRWGGKESIVREESMRSVELTKTSSFKVPDLSIDTSDLMMDLSSSSKDAEGDAGSLGVRELGDTSLGDLSLGVQPLGGGRQSPTEDGHTTVVTNTEVHYHKADINADTPSAPEGNISVRLNNDEDDPNSSNISTATTASASSAITVIEMTTSRAEEARDSASAVLTDNTAELRMEDETTPTMARRKRKGDRGSISSDDDDEQKKAKKDGEFKLDIAGIMGEFGSDGDDKLKEKRLDMSPDSLNNDSDINLDISMEQQQQQQQQEAEKPEGLLKLVMDSPSLWPTGPPNAANNSMAKVYEDAALSAQTSETLTVQTTTGDSSDDEAPGLPSSPPPSSPPPSHDPEDDSMQDVLKDYFSDQPSLLHELGLGDDGESLSGEEETEVNKYGEKVIVMTTPRTETTVESPDSGLMVNLEDNGKRSSSDDSDELSSPASSPSKDPEPTSSGKSPVISRHSGGGLAFDISAMEFNDLPQEVPEKPRGDPTGGIAYYVSIDEPQAFSMDGLLSRDTDDSQPSLVRSWGVNNNEPNYPSSVVQETTSSLHVDTTSNTNHTTDIEQQVSSKTTVKHSDSGFNGMSGDSTPVHSPTDKHGTSITVVEHQEIHGAYTVHVGSEGQSKEDSEA